MKTQHLLLAALFITGLQSCREDGHDHDHDKDGNPPTIQINNPRKSMYEVGDTAFVNVVVSDEKELHEASCYFITTPQNDTLWQQKRHAHSKTINFNSFYRIGVLPEKQLVDFVVVAENATGKTTRASQRFEVHQH
ncbi:MAG: hypothetical protein ACK5XN_32615 [Bacteroidota bacterium]